MNLIPMVAFLLGAAGAAERPALSGVVTDGSGKPIGAALVFIYTARPRTGTSTNCPSCYLDCRKRAETNAKGEFRIETVDPTLVFKVGATKEGFSASFRQDVDPAAGPMAISLAQPLPLPENPRRQLRARVVDARGAPVLGALVQAVGHEIAVDGQPDASQRSFGPTGI